MSYSQLVYGTWYILVRSSTRKLKEARGRYVLATTRTGVRIYPRVLTKYLLRYGVASFCGKGIVPTAVYGTRHIYRLPYEVPLVSGNVRPPASKGSAGFLKRPRLRLLGCFSYMMTFFVLQYVLLFLSPSDNVSYLT